MSERSIRTALISTDRGFREVVKDVFLSHEGWAAPALEITAPFESLGEEQVRALRQLLPELLILDIDDSPELGIRFAQFLSRDHARHPIHRRGPAAAAGAPADGHACRGRRLPAQAGDRRGASRRARPRPCGAGYRKEGRRSQEQVRSTSFYSPKGGAGTTTTATNFAVVLHRLTGKKTLLVDLDLELGEIALLLGVQPRFNFVDMVQNFHRMDAELLASYIERHESGVHLLSAPYQPEKAEVVTGGGDPPDSPVPPQALRLPGGGYLEVVLARDAGLAGAGRPRLRRHQRGPGLAQEPPAGPPTAQADARPGREAHPAGREPLPSRQRDLAGGRPADARHTRCTTRSCNDYEEVSRSISTGKPIVLNGNSKFSRDMKGLGAQVTGHPWQGRPWRPLPRAVRAASPRVQGLEGVTA